MLLNAGNKIYGAHKFRTNHWSYTISLFPTNSFYFFTCFYILLCEEALPL